MFSEFFRRINRDGLICVKDVACSQNAAHSFVPQGQAEGSHFLCLTNTALQVGDEVNLPTTVYENFFLPLAAPSTLKQHGRPPR